MILLAHMIVIYSRCLAFFTPTNWSKTVIDPTDSLQCDQPSPKLDAFKEWLQLKLDQKLAHLQSECEKSVKLVRGEIRKIRKFAEYDWCDSVGLTLFQWEDLTKVRNRIQRMWSEHFSPLLLKSIERIWLEGSCEMIEIFQSDVARLLQNVKFVPYPDGDAYIGTIVAGRRDGWGVLDYLGHFTQRYDWGRRVGRRESQGI